MISRSRASKAELLLRGINRLSSAGKRSPWQTRSQDMKEISNELSKDILSADQSMGKHADETSVKGSNERHQDTENTLSRTSRQFHL